MYRRLAVTILLIGAMLLAPTVVMGQLTYDQAEAEFQQLGCTSCHNGGTAPPFDEVVQMIQSWSQNYNSLDEAVAAEVVAFGKSYDSYDAMMQDMAQFTGKTLDDIQNIYQFFIDVFEGNVQVGGGGGETTTTAGEAGGEAQQGGSLAPAIIAGIVLAIIIAGAAYMLSSRK